jgi:hypothetical protein
MHSYLQAPSTYTSVFLHNSCTLTRMHYAYSTIIPAARRSAREGAVGAVGEGVLGVVSGRFHILPDNCQLS